MPNNTSLRIYCIYNSNGSILGEITYLWKKLFFNFIVHFVMFLIILSWKNRFGKKKCLILNTD